MQAALGALVLLTALMFPAKGRWSSRRRRVPRLLACCNRAPLAFRDASTRFSGQRVGRRFDKICLRAACPHMAARHRDRGLHLPATCCVVEPLYLCLLHPLISLKFGFPMDDNTHGPGAPRAHEFAAHGLLSGRNQRICTCGPICGDIPTLVSRSTWYLHNPSAAREDYVLITSH